jgi:hypothetical protein
MLSILNGKNGIMKVLVDLHYFYMNITLFLAELWGPVLLAVGAGLFVSRRYYRNVYRGIESEPLATMAFGMIAMVVGILQVMAHNVWHGTPEIIVTLLGWGTLIKGTMVLVAPESAGKMVRQFQMTKLIPMSAGIVLLIGFYLTWFAFFG